jgi:hypothetical protein
MTTKPIRYDGSELDPRVSPFNEVLSNLVSLNEIISAAFSGWALGEKPDEHFAQLVNDTLRDHSWRLGFEFNGSRPSAEWLARDEYERKESLSAEGNATTTDLGVSRGQTSTDSDSRTPGRY